MLEDLPLIRATQQRIIIKFTIVAIVCAAPVCLAAEPVPSTKPAPTITDTDMKAVLTPEQWTLVDKSVDRALAWLATQQQADGCIPVPQQHLDFAQPAVTALAVMAFLSRGHVPNEGPFGKHIARGIDYVMSCQQKDGLLALRPPRPNVHVIISESAAYNHAISGLMLTEVYGMTSGETNKKVRAAIESALKLALQKVPQPKRYPDDEGGWRYHVVWQSCDSDLSVTSWHLMFLRSCRNAGFDVPSPPIDDALAFVARCFDPKEHHFWYALRDKERVWTRAMVGAGILSLSLSGKHRLAMAQQAGDWLVDHPFNRYCDRVGKFDRFFYGAFYCSHAAFQLGGKHWKEVYPPLARTLLTNQRPDGSWDPEVGTDKMYGSNYSTSLAVLALSPPYQLLPIFQR